MARQRAKGIQQSKFGYKSLTLKTSSVDRLTSEFEKFQGDSGKPLTNYPTLSEFLDTVLTVFGTPADKLPRLLLVSKSNWRTVIYDTEARRPVVVDVYKKGSLGCTRVRDVDLYVSFAKKMNPEMFNKVKQK